MTAKKLWSNIKKVAVSYPFTAAAFFVAGALAGAWLL